jgi:hypothetical protein
VAAYIGDVRGVQDRRGSMLSTYLTCSPVPCFSTLVGRKADQSTTSPYYRQQELECTSAASAWDPYK